jgi:Na+-transporting NADH:ubiquinone oxidoreductase subunit C
VINAALRSRFTVLMRFGERRGIMFAALDHGAHATRRRARLRPDEAQGEGRPVNKAMSPVLRAAVILLVLTSVCTLLLAGGNLLYEGVKAERQRALRMAILDVFGEKFDDGSFDEVFRGLVTVEERPKDKATLFLYQGTPRQAALLVSGPGLWGVIEMLVFLDTDAPDLRVAHPGGAGLGGRIEEEWFLNQFEPEPPSVRCRSARGCERG